MEVEKFLDFRLSSSSSCLTVDRTQPQNRLGYTCMHNDTTKYNNEKRVR